MCIYLSSLSEALSIYPKQTSAEFEEWVRASVEAKKAICSLNLLHSESKHYQGTAVSFTISINKHMWSEGNTHAKESNR